MLLLGCWSFFVDLLFLIGVETHDFIISLLVVFRFHYFKLAGLTLRDPRRTVVQIQLRLFAQRDLVAINVHEDAFGASEDFKARVYADGLPYSQVEDRVMSVWNVL